MRMGIGVGLVLIAAGAILIWGVTGEVSGLDVDAIGVILLVIGIIGVLLDALWWQSWTGGPWRRTTYVEGGTAGPSRPWPRRRVVVDEEDAPGPAPGPGPGPGAPPPP